MREQITQEVVKAAPPVAVATAHKVAGWTLNDALLIATIAYVILQAGYLMWKWYHEWRKK